MIGLSDPVTDSIPIELDLVNPRILQSRFYPGRIRFTNLRIILGLCNPFFSGTGISWLCGLEPDYDVIKVSSKGP